MDIKQFKTKFKDLQKECRQLEKDFNSLHKRISKFQNKSVRLAKDAFEGPNPIDEDEINHLTHNELTSIKNIDGSLEYIADSLYLFRTFDPTTHFENSIKKQAFNHE